VTLFHSPPADFPAESLFIHSPVLTAAEILYKRGRMQEIRFHGRGGQGTVVASIVLARSVFDTGQYVQAFPLFGVERRGAPVEAYLRVDTKKILVRSGVYQPDHVVVMDRRLVDQVAVTRGLKSGGWVLINAPESPAPIDRFKGFRLAWVDASRIASDLHLGTRTLPMINTAMLGAFAGVMGYPSVGGLMAVIKKEISVKPDANAEAAKAAYDAVRIVDAMG